MVSKLFFDQIFWNSNDWIVRNRRVSAKAIGLKTVVLHNTADREETVFDHIKFLKISLSHKDEAISAEYATFVFHSAVQMH